MAAFSSTAFNTSAFSESAFSFDSVIVETTEIPGLSGGKPERKRKQHENLPFSPEDYQRSFEKEPTKEISKEVRKESAHEPVEQTLSPIDREIQGYLMDMGLIDPSRVQRIIEENERIDRKRRQNFAAIALLLLD